MACQCLTCMSRSTNTHHGKCPKGGECVYMNMVLLEKRLERDETTADQERRQFTSVPQKYCFSRPHFPPKKERVSPFTARRDRCVQFSMAVQLYLRKDAVLVRVPKTREGLPFFLASAHIHTTRRLRSQKSVDALQALDWKSVIYCLLKTTIGSVNFCTITSTAQDRN